MPRRPQEYRQAAKEADEAPSRTEGENAEEELDVDTMQNQETPTRNAAREDKQGEGDAIRGHREVAEAEAESPEGRMSTDVNSQPDDD